MSSKQKILSIILPTFNEKGNVKILVEKITKSFKNTRHNYEIIFADDSNDDTPEIIKGEIRKNSRIRLVDGPREGLASALMKGFGTAHGKYICCIDADLQHPPEKILGLLEKAIATDADIVAGTRYSKGGSTMGLGSLKTCYGIYRRAVSLGVKYFTQIIFIQTRKTSDPLGGFFLFKKSILEGVKLQPKGFKILVEMLMRTKYKKVEEVSYTFLLRENDDSKATIAQGLEYINHLWFIFRTIPEAGRFLKFCIVGLSGVFVNLGILTLLVEVFNQDKDGIAYIVAILVSILTNFSINSVFTYSDKRSSSRRESIRRMIFYYLISGLVMLFNYAIYRFCLSLGIFYIFSAFIAIIFATGLNFVLATKLVWKMKVRA